VPEPVYQQNLQAAQAFAEDDTSMDAVFARAAVQSHREWLVHDNTRLRARLAWRAFFADWDVLVCPISATVAFPHDHRPPNERTLMVNGVQRPYFESSFWAGMTSLPGLPSTVFPTGLAGDGLPIGLQAVAGEFEDRTAIEFARLMAQEIGGYQVPPAFI
jgi:amidase